jgi:hypothetical protein
MNLGQNAYLAFVVAIEKATHWLYLICHSNPSYVSSIVVPIVGRLESLEFCNQKERKKENHDI